MKNSLCRSLSYHKGLNTERTISRGKLVHKTTEAGFRAPCDCASVPTTSKCPFQTNQRHTIVSLSSGKIHMNCIPEDKDLCTTQCDELLFYLI